jgi:gliding motility-associated-like protein
MVYNRFLAIFACFIFCLTIHDTKLSAQNLIINGDFELGEGGIATVPTFWDIVSGSPDHCESIPTSCVGLPPVIGTPSPQGGKWVRFFFASTNQGINNEIFGQQLQQPLVQGQEYRITLYIAHTAINPVIPATPTASVMIGFSNGSPTNNQVGAFDRNDVQTAAIGNWIQRSFTFTASGNYNYISIGKTMMESQNACYVDDIVLEPTCSVFIGNDKNLCEGESHLLDATKPNSEYLWQDGSTSPTFNVTAEGTYWVQVSSPDCIASDTITVTYSPVIPFSVNIGNDTTLCEGETLTLSSQIANGNFLWQDGSTSSSFLVSSPGTYYLTVSLNACSINNDTINVSYISPEDVNLGNDTSLCEGEPLTLSLSFPEASYLWQNGSTNNSIQVNQGGLYWVEVRFGDCTASDSINVNFNPKPEIELPFNVSFCVGDSVMVDAAQDGVSYLWQDGSQSAQYIINAAGTYTVTVTNNFNCTKSHTIEANSVLPPQIEFDNDTLYECNGNTITLDAFVPEASYLWSNNSTSSEINVSESGIYFVTVALATCSASDTIEVIFESCNVLVEMPNVFTPNGDGINETFIPKSFEGVKSARILIFNRWGKLVFETDNVPLGWNGGNQPDGVYFYVLNYADDQGNTTELKGTVTLIK